MGSEPRRLHPASIIFALLRLAKALILPGLIVVFAARDDTWQIWAMAFFLPFAAFEVVRYLTLRYRVTESELVVTSAFIGRRERHIPLSRINNIDLVQSPLHRAFRVAEVRIQTGSGAEPEAALRVLSLDAVEQLRAGLFAGRHAGETGAGGAPGQEPEAETLLQLPPRELVLLGLVSHRALALLAVALGLAWELELLDSDTVEQVEPLVAQVTSPAAWAMLAVAALATLTVLSIMWSFLRFWGFRLQRSGDDLRITSGLLTRTSATIPRRRIQVVAVHESALRRLLRRASVRVKTAGGAKTDGDRSGAAWFAPLIGRDRLGPLLESVRPGLDPVTAQWRPLTKRARRRMIRRGVIIGLVLWIVVAIALRSWWALAGAPLPLLTGLVAYRAWRASRYSASGNSVRARTGALNRRTLTTFDDKAQVVSVRQSPLDRLWGMASVRVDTAGAGLTDRLLIPMLDEPEAIALARTLGARAENAGFHW